MELNVIYNEDCYEGLKKIPDKSVDLVYIDVPYLIESGGGGHSELGQRIEKTNHQDLKEISDGIDYKLFDELVRVMKKIYIFIWCSKEQILDIMKIFIDKYGCRYNLLVWCLSGGTKVYIKGKKGVTVTTIKDLTRLNYSEVELWNGTKWTKIKGIVENKEPHNVKQIQLRSGEKIMCTGRHYFPTQRGLVPAFDLQVGDIIDSCQLPDNDFIKPIYLTDDLLWLIGLFLAEGSYSDDCMQLSLHSDEFVWFDKIQNVTKSLGGNATYTITNNSLKIRMSGKVLYTILHEYISGNTAKGKHLSTNTWKLNNECLKLVVQGYLDGDGYFDSKNNRYRLGFTKNSDLEDDFRVLAARLGAVLTLNESKSKISKLNKEYDAYRGEWRWEKSTHYNKNRQEIVEIKDVNNPNNAKFWDIEVEDEPHLFSLASGTLTHNCKSNPTPATNNVWLPDLEYCLVFKEKGAPRYNDGYELKSKWYVSPINKKDKDLYDHPTIKPLELVERHILHATQPGDVVLDCFMGSGTTAMACKETGRNYIGFEIDPNYYQISINRLNGVTQRQKEVEEETGVKFESLW